MRGATGRYWAHNMGFDDFNPRSPCGERHHYVNGKSSPNEISTHAPHAGSDEAKPQLLERMSISTHAPHAGSDVPFRCSYHWYLLFQPTLPMRGATGLMRHLRACREFQPTLPMRGATVTDIEAALANTISTHAPHAGSDDLRSARVHERRISTHAPHAGSDWVSIDKIERQFNFNPRSPCGERPAWYRASSL